MEMKQSRLEGASINEHPSLIQSPFLPFAAGTTLDLEHPML